MGYGVGQVPRCASAAVTTAAPTGTRFSRAAWFEQDNAKTGTTRRGRGDRQLAFMAVDDHSADCQSQAHSVRLRRNKGVEYRVALFRAESRAGVFHHEVNCGVAIQPRSDSQHALPIDRAHCFHGIVDQVDDDLLQLPPVTDDGRQFGGQLDAGLNAMLLKSASKARKASRVRLFKSTWFLVGTAFLNNARTLSNI